MKICYCRQCRCAQRVRCKSFLLNCGKTNDECIRDFYWSGMQLHINHPLSLKFNSYKVHSYHMQILNSRFIYIYIYIYIYCNSIVQFERHTCTYDALGSIGPRQYILEVSTGPKFPARPATFFFRPGPARNQCIIKILLYNFFEILQQNQYNYIKLHSYFPLVQLLYCPTHRRRVNKIFTQAQINQ